MLFVEFLCYSRTLGIKKMCSLEQKVWYWAHQQQQASDLLLERLGMILLHAEV
jgi:hypothetical protein